MSDKKIMIRDTRTGVSAWMKASMLNHPAFAEFFQEVRSDKPVKNVPAVKSDKKEEPVAESKTKTFGRGDK